MDSKELAKVVDFGTMPLPPQHRVGLVRRKCFHKHPAGRSRTSALFSQRASHRLSIQVVAKQHIISTHADDEVFHTTMVCVKAVPTPDGLF
jgi:hypothetical protein